jgi:spore germination protein GerM
MTPLFLWVWILFCGPTGAQAPSSLFQEREDLFPGWEQGEKTVVHIYFADKSGKFLTAEKRVIEGSEDSIEAARRILTELIQGPKSDLTRTMAPATRLRALFQTDDGTAYVDLTQAVAENHPGGCRDELLTVYSIVNSLVLNIDKVEAVKLLIEGQEALTLAGHIDLRFLFKADMLLIR